MRDVAVELRGTAALGFLLPRELALGLGEEVVALVCILAVFLECHGLVLVPKVFGPSDLELGAGVLELHRLVVEAVIEASDLLVQTVQLGRFRV